MISLFEAVGEAPRAMPLDLVTRGGRGIELLQFASCDPRPVTPVDNCVAVEPELAVDERALQIAAMVEAAREEAAASAKAHWEQELETQLQAERRRAQQACAVFADEQQRYFAEVEGQVVKLALAVARKVLAREVAADAMHLTATVRAALARVQDGSRCVLRVPINEASAWSELLGVEADVVGEARVPDGECVLESRVGRVELGVRPQMDEIERGFAELLEREAA